MILLLDNYDSFTHNLYQYLSEITSERVQVVRNDRITVDEVRALAPSRIIISPGPGRPADAGISIALIQAFAGSIPILGVCLGHQAIGEAFGGRIVGAKRIVHGKAEPMRLDGQGVFRTIGTAATFMRYHSLVIDPDSLPSELEVSAYSEDDEIMGVRHREHLVEGVQFHPESIGSAAGMDVLRAFLHYRRDPFDYVGTLNRVIEGHDLSFEEAQRFMEEVTDGSLTPAQIAGVLVGLNAKGIAASEVAGCASVLQRRRVPVNVSGETLDTCGTGGDGLGTFNISSFCALVAAACGAKVAKHGNRAVSSISGSADFYRSLGLNVDLAPAACERFLEDEGFAFLFAPLYHSAMKHAAVPRRELKIKTVFNLVGPLSNPAGAAYQLIGVFDPRFCRVVAEAGRELGLKRALVVHGHDGLDEISPAALTTAALLEPDGTIREFVIDPADYGIHGHETKDLAGGTAEDNAAMARDLLAGGGPAAVRDAVLLNSGAALWVAGIASDLAEGVEKVREALDDGSAARRVKEILKSSHDTTPDEGAA